MFVGGILVFLFYLGIFGHYYKFTQGYSFFGGVITVLFFFEVIHCVLVKSLGEFSDFYFSWLFFSLIRGVLFFVLILVSKLNGYGRALRRF